MLRRLNILAVLVLAVVVLDSCGKSYRDMRLTSVSLASVTPSGLKSLDAVLRLGIDNPAPPFIAEDVEVEVFRNGNPVLAFNSPGLMIEGRTSKPYELSVRGSLGDGFNLMSLMSMLATRDLSPFTVDIRVSIALRENGPRKKLRLKHIPAEKLLSGKLL